LLSDKLKLGHYSDFDPPRQPSNDSKVFNRALPVIHSLRDDQLTGVQRFCGGVAKPLQTRLRIVGCPCRAVVEHLLERSVSRNPIFQKGPLKVYAGDGQAAALAGLISCLVNGVGHRG
jgi:hypothetical protein